MDLVLDIGNFRIKGALFEEDKLVELFRLAPNRDALDASIQGKTIDRILISSVNDPVCQEVCKQFREKGQDPKLLDFETLKIELDVDEPEAVGHDRIANVYGALHRFPQNDCVVVDLGTAVTFDYVGASGQYKGGAIYPGMAIGAKSLSEYTDKLPEVSIEKPDLPIGKTTISHIQNGLYYGLLGAIERITFEMRRCHPSPSDVKVIATGGLFHQPIGKTLASDLSDLVDLIDPALTLIGIHETMKEQL